LKYRIGILLKTIDDIENNTAGATKNIVRPTRTDSIESVREVFMVLKRRVNRAHITQAAKELFLTFAKGAEVLFNGKREWFGFKPDLTNWSQTVNTKLNKMQYETSNFVGSIFNDGKLSYGMLLALEFVPSAVLHSINRAQIKDEREKRQWKDMTESELSRARSSIDETKN
jgi:hypothetical protein